MEQLAKLGLSQQAKVTDALTGEAIPHANGNLKLDIDGWRYRVLRIRPK